MSPEPPPESPSKLKPGAFLQVGAVAYKVLRVLHRPLPEEDIRETVLLAQCLSGGAFQGEALLRCLEGPTDAPARQHARHGGRLAQSMNHPHIAKVWQVHDDPSALYLVSEYLAGLDLETVASFCAMLKRPPRTAFVCYVGAAVADALDYAHRLRDDTGQPLGIVHRRINLENIRLSLGGEVKLAGFDGMFSKSRERRLTTTNTLRADIAYAAPEYVCQGQQDRRLDFFALGMVLLELLMGRHPLDDPNELAVEQPSAEVHGGRSLQAEQPSWLPLDVLARRLTDFGPEQVELAALEQPEAVVALLKRALEREPEKRYQTGAEMRDDLNAYLTRLPVPYGPDRVKEEMRHLREQASPLDR